MTSKEIIKVLVMTALSIVILITLSGDYSRNHKDMIPINSHSDSHYAVDTQEAKQNGLIAKQIFQRILAVSKLHGQNILLYRHLTNAFVGYSTMDVTGQQSVHLSNGSIAQLLQNKNWLAGVIGHELGHIARGDTGASPSRAKFCDASVANGRVCEHDADLLGQRLATRAGYDGCAMSDLFNYWVQIYGDNSDPKDVHPLNSERAAYTKCN